MKATLTFTLPDEREPFEDALKGDHYRRALEEIVESFRQKDKYSEKQETTWGEAKALLYAVIAESGVEL